MLLSKIKGIH